MSRVSFAPQIPNMQSNLKTAYKNSSNLNLNINKYIDNSAASMDIKLAIKKAYNVPVPLDSFIDRSNIVSPQDGLEVLAASTSAVLTSSHLTSHFYSDLGKNLVATTNSSTRYIDRVAIALTNPPANSNPSITLQNYSLGMSSIAAGVAINAGVNEIYAANNHYLEASRQSIGFTVSTLIAEKAYAGLVTSSLASSIGLSVVGATAASIAIGAAAGYAIKFSWDVIADYITDAKAKGLTIEQAIAETGKVYNDYIQDIFNTIKDEADSEIQDVADFFGDLVDAVPGVDKLPPWIPDWLIPGMDGSHGSAMPWQDGSPLIIDLDKDGIELTDLKTNGVYWDIDNDGFRDATAWVKGDDGLLVIDRNTDGVINNHSELFGTQTVDGFTKLRELDSNKDNKIDAADAQYKDLKIWRDLNQDGVSQANELQTLAQVGVKSINLNATSVNEYIADNRITHTSSVTMSDNTTRTIVDAWFKYDDTNTQYSKEYTLDQRTLKLPTLRGYGEVEDLHIGMSLKPTTLLTMVQALSGVTLANLVNPTFDYDTKFRHVMYEWAGVDKARQVIGTGFGGQELAWWNGGYDLRKTSFLDDLSGRNYSDGVYVAQYGGLISYRPTTLSDTWQVAQTHIEARFLAQSVLKPLFAGTPVYNINTDTVEGITGLSATGFNAIKAEIAKSTDKLYGWTLVTRAVEGTIGVANLKAADYTLLDNAIKAAVSGQTLATILTAVTKGMYETPVQGAYDKANTMNGTASDDVLYGGNLNDRLNGGHGDDWLFGGTGNDTYEGGYGDDHMHETAYISSDDTYIYTAGHDVIRETLYGAGTDKIILPTGVTLADLTLTRIISGVGNIDLDIAVKNKGLITIVSQYAHADYRMVETIQFADGKTLNLLTLDAPQIGTAGNDTINGADRAYYVRDVIDGKEGNDTLKGGLGDDVLNGGTGNDTFIYTAGVDTIRDNDGADKLVFDAGYDPTKFTYEATTGDLDYSANRNLNVMYNGKLVTVIKDQFYHAGTMVEQLAVTGKTAITLGAVQVVQKGTDQAEQIIGITSGASVNNKIYTYGGNDNIYAYEGNDLIDAGLGDDIIYGGSGNDTYVYSGGLDRIYEESGSDTIQFGTGLTQANIKLQRDTTNRDHVNIVVNNNIALAIMNHFVPGNEVETLQFANGTTFNLGAYKNLIGTEGADTLNGLDHALLTDDVLLGKGGNDTLNGKAGNDYLEGGTGNDTYVYGLNSGVDTITDGWSGGGTDTLLFGTGITASMLTLERDNNNLNLKINGQLATILKDQFSSTDINSIELIRFADNTTINLATYSFTLTGTANGEWLTGIDKGAGGDIIKGLGGDDTLSGLGGNDTLNGGAGNDNVFGGQGNDTYIYEGGVDTFTEEGGMDVISLSSAFKRADLTFERSGYYDVDILFKGVKAITLSNQFLGADGSYAFETLKFADNTTINLTTYKFLIKATDGADTLYGVGSGGDPHDAINGLGGDDYINGLAGNDIINGGQGNDTLVGSTGTDTFVFDKLSVGQGVDTIQDFNAAEDTIRLTDVLTGYTGPASINNFVRLEDTGYQSTLMVDKDGAGKSFAFQPVAAVYGLTGYDADDLLSTSHLYIG